MKLNFKCSERKLLILNYKGECVVMVNTKNIKILIVDDDSTSRCILKKVLSEAGYDIIEAVTGKEALKKNRC